MSLRILEEIIYHKFVRVLDILFDERNTKNYGPSLVVNTTNQYKIPHKPSLDDSSVDKDEVIIQLIVRFHLLGLKIYVLWMLVFI